MALRKSKPRHFFFCEQYPQYTFLSKTGWSVQGMFLDVGIERGLDPTLMIDILVGEVLTLMPLLAPKSKRRARGDTTDERGTVHLKEHDEIIMCRIFSIDQSANGRKAFIAVQRIW